MQRKIFKIVLVVFITTLLVFSLNVRATGDDVSPEDLIVGRDSNRVGTVGNRDDDENEVNNEVENDVESEDNEDDELDSENQVDNSISNRVDNSVQNRADSSSNNTENKVSNRVTSGTYTTPETSGPSSSYSTVTPLPEANLSLNNILNIILIAVGVVLILFAIAILIRLK